jgi:type IV secretory pathway VirJ component
MIRPLRALAGSLPAVALAFAAHAVYAAPPAPAVVDPGAPPGTGGDRAAPHVDGEQRLSYGPFGEVVLYRPKGPVKSVALFVSGDGGWNLGVVEMGRHLVDMNAAVVGIDIRRYIKAINAPTQSCRSYAIDFEGLAHAVEQRLKLPEYLPPVLVGYSSGATLVYAAAVQSPKGTFAGALSMGFCPDLQLTQKACKGSGLEYEWQYAKHGDPPPVVGLVYAASATNMTPWVAFQGAADQVCDSPATREFAGKTKSAELVWLDKVGHGFSVEKNWVPQYKAAYLKLAASATPPPATVAEVRDLPLVEVPATGPPAAGFDDTFVVLLTGDGGWAGLDQDVATALAAAGVPVIGWNSLKYYWTQRTPEGAARDLERILARYAVAWHRPRVLLVGYSFGADALPFLYNRLPEPARANVRSLSLLGLSETAEFEFHVASWIPHADAGGRATVPELQRAAAVRALCLYGTEEGDSPCRRLAGVNVRAVALSGGHHFGGDHAALARHVLEFARD